VGGPSSLQGRGIARAAVGLAVARATADGRHRYIHAFPSVHNAPSNALCRRLGFELLGEEEVEYPKATFMRCSDWRLDLWEER
jgi:RimJ/RimL family protein N-acetyltransferase